MRIFFTIALLFSLSPGSLLAQNAVFDDLMQNGVKMSDGATQKPAPPILADGLDAAAQHAAIERAADGRHTYDELVKQGYYTPVVVKVRTLKPFRDEEKPAVRAVDVWFIARGDWEKLNSSEFLDSLTKKSDEGKSRVVAKAGILAADELAARGLHAAKTDAQDERFIHTTFSLFERVEISITRFSVLSRGNESLLVAGRIDSRFAKDEKYSNQWRALLRDERAEIHAGPAKVYANAGGYAKITRLKEPADGIFVECHLVYEEPYAWFDGANLVKQKVPAMVQEKVRSFRRKLAAAAK